MSQVQKRKPQMPDQEVEEEKKEDLKVPTVSKAFKKATAELIRSVETIVPICCCGNPGCTIGPMTGKHNLKTGETKQGKGCC